MNRSFVTLGTLGVALLAASSAQAGFTGSLINVGAPITVGSPTNLVSLDTNSSSAITGTLRAFNSDLPSFAQVTGHATASAGAWATVVPQQSLTVNASATLMLAIGMGPALWSTNPSFDASAGYDVTNPQGPYSMKIEAHDFSGNLRTFYSNQSPNPLTVYEPADGTYDHWSMPANILPANLQSFPLTLGPVTVNVATQLTGDVHLQLSGWVGPLDNEVVIQADPNLSLSLYGTAGAGTMISADVNVLYPTSGLVQNGSVSKVQAWAHVFPYQDPATQAWKACALYSAPLWAQGTMDVQTFAEASGFPVPGLPNYPGVDLSVSSLNNYPYPGTCVDVLPPGGGFPRAPTCTLYAGCGTNQSSVDCAPPFAGQRLDIYGWAGSGSPPPLGSSLYTKLYSDATSSTGYFTVLAGGTTQAYYACVSGTSDCTTVQSGNIAACATGGGPKGGCHGICQ